MKSCIRVCLILMLLLLLVSVSAYATPFTQSFSNDEGVYTETVDEEGNVTISGTGKVKYLVDPGIRKSLTFLEGITSTVDTVLWQFEDVYFPSSLTNVYYTYPPSATWIPNLHISDLRTWLTQVSFEKAYGEQDSILSFAKNVWLGDELVHVVAHQVHTSTYIRANWTLFEDNTAYLYFSGSHGFDTSPYWAPWYDYRDKMKSVTVYDAKILPNYTFRECSALSSVTLSNGITTIEGGAFRNCIELREITIPESVNKCSLTAFINCPNLSIIHCKKGSYIDQLFKSQYQMHYVDQPDTICLDRSECLMLLGTETQEITLKVSCEVGFLEPPSLLWNTSDSSVVTVENGKMVAISCGVADVSCQYANGNSNTIICHVSVHDPNIIPGVSATCTEDGISDHIVCKICGSVIKDANIIQAYGHTVIIDPAVAPTSYSTGLTEGSHCSVCGTVLVAQQVIDMIYAPEIDVKLGDCRHVTVPEGFSANQVSWVNNRLTYKGVDSDRDWIRIERFYNPRDYQTAKDYLMDEGYHDVYYFSDPLIAGVAIDDRILFAWIEDDYDYELDVNRFIYIAEFSTDNYRFRMSSNRQSARNHMMGCVQIAHSPTVQQGDCRIATQEEDGYTGVIVCKDCGSLMKGNRTVSKNKLFTLPTNLKIIEPYALYGAKGSQVIIPNGCKRIESAAFYNSDFLIYVIPDSVTYIDDSAFDNYDSPVIVVNSMNSTAALWAEAHGIAVWCNK